MPDIKSILEQRGMHDPSKEKKEDTTLQDDPNKVVDDPNKVVDDPNKKKEPTTYNVEWDKVEDEQIFVHLTGKVGREVKSWEDLQQQTIEIEKEVEKIVQAELPPEIEAALKYTTDTGRGLSDFMKTQKDWTQEQDEIVLREYLASQNPELSREHIDILMEDYNIPEKLSGEDYTPEEIAAREKQIKLAEISRLQDISRARKHFEDSKQQYLTPLEQRKAELEQQAAQGKEVWTQRTQEAMETVTGFELGEFKYSFKDKESFTKSASSVEDLLGRYKNEQGELDHGKLLKTLIAGEQLESILGDYKAHVEAETIKSQLEQKSNPTLTKDPNQKLDFKEDGATKAKDHLLSVIGKNHGPVMKR